MHNAFPNRLRLTSNICPDWRLAIAIGGWFVMALVGSSIIGNSVVADDSDSQTQSEQKFLSEIRQLTFAGRRAGEGYFNADGSLMVFQSERRDDNPFFQIYLLDLETGDVEPISPGHGKTTCAWVHPDNNRVLFASTQDDPEAKSKQKQEIEFRESGKQKRYSWDYDPSYEIYAYDRKQKSYHQLTDARGYDAEASYSPDGNWIAFASNRSAYANELSEDEEKKFEIDPSVMMEIFIMKSDGTEVRQLTDTPGYDGGPFFSPDGKQICWRRFSEDGVTAEIMTMNVDGSDQRQLTRMNAMSWAPFYHPSGKYLVFTTNKHGFGNFELYLVAADRPSNPVRVTHTDGFDGLASFSPDGKKLTWTSNRNSKKQSQLYLANWDHAAALEALAINEDKSPAVSDAESVAVPTAMQVAVEIDTELDDAENADAEETDPKTFVEVDAVQSGAESAKQAQPDFDPRDIMRHVDYLCRPELSGRMTGSTGERKATAYVAAYFDHLGLKPAGDDDFWFQKFKFPNGAELGPSNQLVATYGGEVLEAGPGHPVVGQVENESVLKSNELMVDKDWRPLTFSSNVEIEPTSVVFAGYGIVAPQRDGQAAYDSYEGIDVTGKWVLVFRFVPEDVTPERRQHLQFYAGLRKKAFYARERGAKGLIIVSGPNSQVRNQLVPMQNDFSPAGSSLAAISVTDDVVKSWLKPLNIDLNTLQSQWDGGEASAGIELADLKISAKLDVKKITGVGRNVIGRLQAGDQPSESFVVVGAHIDHLGTGKTGSSLAKETEQGSVHFGADDNASGVAAMLEIAEYLVDQRRRGKLKLKHDVVFAGWSGEELGLHGSKHFVDSIVGQADSSDGPNSDAQPAETDSFHEFVVVVQPNGTLWVNGEESSQEEIENSLAFIGENAPDFKIEIQADRETKTSAVKHVVALAKKHRVTQVRLTKVPEKEQTPPRRIIAALNMDMVGRLEDKLILQGIGSSSYWPTAIESKNAVIGLPLSLSDDTDLPTDASSFYRAGVPILSAFTGSHTDYHTPRDTPDKLNYPETARVARLMGLLTRSLATSDTIPDFVRRASQPKPSTRGGQRAYLGTIPSYGDDVVGVKLSDVTAGAPAAVAGVQGGDIIVGLAGKKIENIYDYTAVIDALKIGQATKIIVERDGEKLELDITPASRQ